RGTHSFEVDALGRKRTRLRHTLDTELERKLVLLRPILLGQHDALVEDILDRAQLVSTGRLDQPARHPIWLRCLNGFDLRLARLRGKLAAPQTDEPQRRRLRLLGVLVPGTLAGLAALHGAWALGWRWPGSSDQELADYVVGYGAGLPSAGLTWAVAALLLAAAATVRAGANGARGPVRKAAWGVSGVLLARGLVSIPIDLARSLEDVYDRPTSPSTRPCASRSDSRPRGCSRAAATTREASSPPRWRSREAHGRQSRCPRAEPSNAPRRRPATSSR
ncbi:MAG: DUF3995 domain-containing protein, partial [Thermoleophilaceae bacterium]